MLQFTMDLNEFNMMLGEVWRVDDAATVSITIYPKIPPNDPTNSHKWPTLGGVARFSILVEHHKYRHDYDVKGRFEGPGAGGWWVPYRLGELRRLCRGMTQEACKPDKLGAFESLKVCASTEGLELVCCRMTWKLAAAVESTTPIATT